MSISKKICIQNEKLIDQILKGPELRYINKLTYKFITNNKILLERINNSFNNIVINKTYKIITKNKYKITDYGVRISELKEELGKIKEELKEF